MKAWPSLTLSLSWLSPPSRFTRDLIWGVVIGLTISLSSTSAALFLQQRRRRKAVGQIPDPGPIELRSGGIVNGVEGLIGNTPLVRINSLSDALGCEILVGKSSWSLSIDAKAEFLNPAGSPKDRVALQMVQNAELDGWLHPHTGSCIFEGTVGSTGISLATIARAKGYRCTIIIPDDVAVEKYQLLEKLGATVEKVRPASIVDKKQFVNVAKRRAEEFGNQGEEGVQLVGPHAKFLNARGEDMGARREDMVVSTTASRKELERGDGEALEVKPRGFFADQFENLANFEAHYKHTGPEIWRQTSGRIDAFVSGAGTGGTLSGIATFLKSVKDDILVVLADPPGSGLYNKVKFNVMYAPEEREGTKRRHQVDTVVEGIGINRITRNMEQGIPVVDDAVRVTDAEAVAMSRHLALNDGFFLGSSTAVNLVAAVKTAKKLKQARSALDERPVVVTILCDAGARHLSKFHSDEYLSAAGIPISSDISDLLAN